MLYNLLLGPRRYAYAVELKKNNDLQTSIAIKYYDIKNVPYCGWVENWTLSENKYNEIINNTFKSIENKLKKY